MLRDQTALAPIPALIVLLNTPFSLEQQSPRDPILSDPLEPLGLDIPDTREKGKGHPSTPTEPSPCPRIPNDNPILLSEDVKAYGAMVKKMDTFLWTPNYSETAGGQGCYLQHRAM